MGRETKSYARTGNTSTQQQQQNRDNKLCLPELLRVYIKLITRIIAKTQGEGSTTDGLEITRTKGFASAQIYAFEQAMKNAVGTNTTDLFIAGKGKPPTPLAKKEAWLYRWIMQTNETI